MKGVTSYLVQEKNQEIKLVLNDVVATSDSNNPNWNHDVLFTHTNYDEKALKEMKLSKEQYAEIGENLIIRLLATNGFLSNNT